MSESFQEPAELDPPDEAEDEDDRAEPPGRRRTWWHPLLARLLAWALQDAYEVRDEVRQGRLPLQLDLLLARRTGELPDRARRELASLLPLLADYTLVEFKSPSDVLRTGDLGHFLGCTLLYHSRQRPPLERAQVSTLIVAPTLEDDAGRLGLVLHERRPGVWEAEGGFFPLWILETDRLFETDDSALGLFSRIFVRDPLPITERWRDTPHAEILHFVIQQIEQFQRLGEEFAMQHTDVSTMNRACEELQERVLASATPKQRLRGLSPEERLDGLSPEELERVRRWLEQRLPPTPPEPHEAS